MKQAEHEGRNHALINLRVSKSSLILRESSDLPWQRVSTSAKNPGYGCSSQ